MPDGCELRQSKYLNNLVDASTIALSNGSSSLGWASLNKVSDSMLTPEKVDTCFVQEYFYLMDNCFDCCYQGRPT